MSIELIIDGKKIVGERGQTILQAALKNEIYIPTLCHHPKLPVTGSCRICLVDVGMRDRLVAACTMPISNGMVVETKNKRVLNSRRTNLQLLLSNHKIDCLTCERNGSCTLQDLAYEYEIELDEIPFEIQERDLPIDNSSPTISYDPKKCILCGLCVSACNDVQHHGVLNYGHRGSDTIVITDIGELWVNSGCVYCGECVQVCPTDALTEKDSRFKGQWWKLEKVSTVCPYCGVGCNIDVYVKDDEIIKIRGSEDGVTNQGSLCVKGRFGYDYVNSEDRLKNPFIRKDGKLVETTWEEALETAATQFKKIRDKYGKDSLGALSSAKCTNEENYLFQKFVRTCFGTNNVDHCARLCHASTVAGLARAFGSGAMTNSTRELLTSDVIFVIGSNTTENHPVIGMYIKQAVSNNTTKLIVADPRRIELTDYSHIWLRHRNGTDVALLNSLMNVILKEDIQDKDFIRERCENFEEFKRVIQDYTPERVEEITGVPAQKIKEAAEIFGKAKRASIFYSMGITQHTTGTGNVMSIANLAMLTGNIGKEGTGVNPLRGQNNVQGACDLGALPDVYTGYQQVTDPKIKKKFEEAWKVQLNDEIGLTHLEMINAAYDGELKGLYIMGENPLLSDPNINKVRESLERLEFLVVQDIFLSETAQMADLVLPGTSSFEKEGTFTNTERRVQKIESCINPRANSWPDWKIISKLSKKMGYDMHYDSPSEIMVEIAELTPIYGGVHYTRLGGDGLQWPCSDRRHPGTPYLHTDKFSRGKGLFIPVNYRPPAEETDNDYPFLLSTGRVLQHFHTGVVSRRSKTLDTLVPEGYVEIHPEDAERLEVKENDELQVESRRGKIVTKAKITNNVVEGSVFIPFHFKEASANILTNDAIDPVAKIPEYKVAAVRISRVT